jgi:hypothetical protein
MLRRSLLADCVGQMVTVSLGIVMVSIHVRHLGVEAYRLLAINAVLLGWVLVLDFGLSSTLCLKLRSLRAGTGLQAEVGPLRESLEKLILSTSAVLFILSIFAAPDVAERWFAKLSLSIALSALIWACTARIDKIVLWKVLPLTDFALFSMATLHASGIMLLANPIQQAFIPRLTTESFGGGERIREMYALATEVTPNEAPRGRKCVFGPRLASVLRAARKRGFVTAPEGQYWLPHSLCARGPVWRHSFLVRSALPTRGQE